MNQQMKKEKNNPKTEATILEVKMLVKDGKRIIDWDYPIKVNAYFLIGVLEDIKHDLLHYVNDEARREIEYYDDEEEE